LKFTKTFKIAINHKDDTKIGHTSDYYPLGVLLEKNGKKLADFPDTDAAIQAATYLSQKNAKETGYEYKEPELDTTYPEFSKFWFVFSLGKEETHTSSTDKTLDGSADLNNLQKLEMGKQFLEGIGWKDGSGASSVSIENAKVTEMRKEVELLKLPQLC